MSSSDTPTLSCTLQIEWMNSQQMTTRKVNFKNGLLRMVRNGFREIFLEISDEKTARHKFHLKNMIVHKKFMNEGKCTINFKDDNARTMMSNAPPAQLVNFLKTMYIKLQGETGGKVSLKERLEGKSAMEEISPLTTKEVLRARDKVVPKDTSTTPKTTMNKKRPVKENDKAQAGHPPSKRRCIASAIETPLTAEQERVLNAVVSGRNIFFTGSAGTGKSFLLKKIISSLPPDSTFPTASTGVAACHIGGYTLHSFAGVGTGQGSLKRLVELARRPHVAQQWRKCKVLIIDEISMVDGRFFDKLEYVAREVRCNDKPFGGIQLVLCGDFFQLPPVGRSNSSGDEGQATFCFQSEAWDRCNLNCYELTVVHRQSDPVFIDILQNIRIGRITPEIVDRLQATINNKVDSAGILASRLCSLTKESQLINTSKLENLSGTEKEFKAIDSDSTLSNMLDIQTPVESLIKLKVGSQVMLMKNITLNDGLVNGARGVVVKFSEGLPVVKFRSGEYTVKYEKWTVKLMGGTTLTRKQLPLKLAWAFSIHKSQGLTLDCVEMSLAKVFEAGQAYVALSRAKSLATLRVLDFDPKQVWANPDVLKFYQRFRQNLAALELIPLGRKKSDLSRKPGPFI
ncbi:ATP-dependent DNA helicase PIF1-like [Thrips palmi]|uniref:ATP-dependent DNA helicase PIF1 n=1 Tax=Thrips palmi TaxID=161013 RepID=A0A6P8ZVF5_THRPL|nr:ATP-dependent DNA helicase PIF1-like [Thrips palmi]XP_034249299.1 ATP-dependent DNA helicase PIF1-like [Thrips palmi]XP_034249308.1 ATP-dependent DNA helicase PIF1-like [Thrips palmi]